MSTRFARWLRRDRDDAGFSLMEVMVGAAIMSVLTAVASQGFLDMYRSADRAEAAAIAQTQLAASFQKLDREVRYAYRVNAAYTSGTSFAITYVVPDANNRPLCVELSLPQAGGDLMRTQWVRQPKTADYEMSTGAVATALVPIAAGANPFRRIPTGTTENGVTSNFDRLELKVDSNVGLDDKNAKRRYELKFTALNTQGATVDLSCVKPAA